jgi:hypothetical protein
MVRMPIPRQQLDQLYVWAERGFCRPKALIAKIVAAWLAKPAPELIAGTTPRSLGMFSEAQRLQVRRRERVVLAWRKARRDRGGKTIKQVTEKFLLHLLMNDEIQISVRTLHNWDRAFRSGGLAGLADGRLMMRSKTYKGDDRSGFKVASMEGHTLARARSAGR